MNYLIALFPPAIDGIVNYIDKFLLEKYSIHPTVIAVYSGIFAFFFSILVSFFTGFFFYSAQSVLVTIISGFLTIILLIPYLKALSMEEASRVGPLFQFVPVLVLIMSFLFLNEQLRVQQYIGSTLIIIAAFLLSVHRLRGGFFIISTSFWYMLLASFLSALSVVLFKAGVDELGFWESIPYEGIGHIIGVVVILLYPNNWSVFLKETKRYEKQILMYMTVVEVLYMLSRYIWFFSLSFLTASVVSVLYGFQPLFILIYGIILSVWFPNIIKEVLHKETLAVKFASVLLIMIGLWLIGNY